MLHQVQSWRKQNNHKKTETDTINTTVLQLLCDINTRKVTPPPAWLKRLTNAWHPPSVADKQASKRTRAAVAAVQPMHSMSTQQVTRGHSYPILLASYSYTYYCIDIDGSSRWRHKTRVPARCTMTVLLLLLIVLVFPCLTISYFWCTYLYLRMPQQQ